MHEYGKQNWENFWEKIEQDGNVGIDYVINPSLYPKILNFLANNPKSVVADFGCGTNFMGVQLLFGYKNSIPALKNIFNVDHARFNTLLYIGIEGSEELVNQSNKYLHDIGNPKNIGIIQSHIDKDFSLFDNNSVDLCVSRNFIMHLSLEDFEAHFNYVSKILKPGSYYIFTTLNPEYELKKAGKSMTNGEKYDFSHGKNGEYGTFFHYYKTQDFQNSIFNKFFTIELVQNCIPITDKFKDSHVRYYENIPMAITYVLKKLIKINN
jgi:SAM-dependent methyltransferase